MRVLNYSTKTGACSDYQIRHGQRGKVVLFRLWALKEKVPHDNPDRDA
jgi:hypothetical protein